MPITLILKCERCSAETKIEIISIDKPAESTEESHTCEYEQRAEILKNPKFDIPKQ